MPTALDSRVATISVALCVAFACLPAVVSAIAGGLLAARRRAGLLGGAIGLACGAASAVLALATTPAHGSAIAWLLLVGMTTGMVLTVCGTFFLDWRPRCPHCRERIMAGASRCPHCRESLRPNGRPVSQPIHSGIDDEEDYHAYAKREPGPDGVLPESASPAPWVGRFDE